MMFSIASVYVAQREGIADARHAPMRAALRWLQRTFLAGVRTNSALCGEAAHGANSLVPLKDAFLCAASTEEVIMNKKKRRCGGV